MRICLLSGAENMFPGGSASASFNYTGVVVTWNLIWFMTGEHCLVCRRAAEQNPFSCRCRHWFVGNTIGNPNPVPPRRSYTSYICNHASGFELYKMEDQHD